MKKLGLLALIALSALLIGCGGGNKLVGTWEGEQGEFTFNKDNTFTAGNKADIPGAPPGMRMAMSGTYELKDDAKTLTFTVTNTDISGVSPEIEKMAEEGAKAAMNKPQTSTLEWKSDNEVVATETSGAKVAYKRK